MFRKFLKTVVLIPIAAALVAWAVANQQSITVSFDPFDTANPAYAVTVPFYLAGFTVLVAGVLLGGIAAWLEQGKGRRARARLATEIDVIRAELAHLRRESAKESAKSESRVARLAGPVANRPPAA
jgi:hypothetical protein